MRPTSNLLSTAIAYYKSAPTMPGCFWYPLCLVVYSCLLQGSVVLWLHMSPHNVCALRAVIFLVRSVHIL